MDSLSTRLFHRVPLAYKFHLLSKALSNEESTVPGYIFEDICSSRTLQSVSESKDVLDFLLISLNTNSSKEKLKVLKVIRYIIVNGEASFRNGLQKKDRSIKEATSFNQDSDPMCGNSLNLAIRNEAKEILRLLFEGFNDSDQATGGLVTKSQEKGFVSSGMGSQSQVGKYEGFGNSPISSNKTVFDRVVSGLTDIADKMLKTPDENAEIANALKADKGNYHAVPIPVDYSLAAENLIPPIIDDSVNQKLNKLTVSARHIPGKAGGGWDTSDNDNFSMNSDLEFNLSSSNILINSPQRCQKNDIDLIGDDYSLEEQFISEIILTEKQFLSWQDLDAACRRCATLNCDKVLSLLRDILMRDKDFIKQKILIFLEALIYHDIVQLDAIISIFDEDLQLLAKEDDSKPYSIKSKKLVLIFKKLHQLQNR